MAQGSQTKALGKVLQAFPSWFPFCLGVDAYLAYPSHVLRLVGIGWNFDEPKFPSQTSKFARDRNR